jgi:Mg/Co/Ni transporter MgtE
VYDYVPGKVDWMARGRPVEGTHASRPTAGKLARSVPTCVPEDALGAVRERAEAAGGLCVVVNESGVVLGILRRSELDHSDDTPVSDAMRPGPSTFRPHVAAKEMAEYLTKHDLETAPVTTPDGRLVGVLYRDDAVKASEGSS